MFKKAVVGQKILMITDLKFPRKASFVKFSSKVNPIAADKTLNKYLRHTCFSGIFDKLSNQLLSKHEKASTNG